MSKPNNNVPNNNMRVIRYLAYGSNLHPARLQARISSAAFSTTAILHGWSLNFSKIGRDGSGKCSIVKSNKDVVYGAVYKISIKDLKQLDVIEGIGKGYRSSIVHVPSVGPCNVYVAQQSFVDHQQVPYDWYKALVLAGARYHLLPTEYIAPIEMTRFKVDLNLKRAKDNLSVLVKKS
jgi:hypothetical protein